MHIPDGFLDVKTAAATAALSMAGIAVALRRTRLSLPVRRVPMMGLAAAFVFAAQMLNFPVAGGTSGHLIGGVLVAVLLGPSAAVLVLTSVLIVQCFVFSDGGVLALGANIFNMGIVSSVGGYALYRIVRSFMPGPRGRLVAVAFASWVATVVAAMVCAGQLAMSHRVPWSVGFPAMAGVHMLIGVGEAIITTLVVFTISNTRPELLEDVEFANITDLSSKRFGRKSLLDVIAFGLLISLGLAMFVSPFASPSPDGLDHVAEKLGFRHFESTARVISSPVPEYMWPGIHSRMAAIALAGAVGTIIVFLLAMLLAKILVPNTTRLIDTAA